MHTRAETSAIWRTSEVLKVLLRRPFKGAEMSPSIHVTKPSLTHTHSPERRNNAAGPVLSCRQIARALTGERPRTGFKRLSAHLYLRVQSAPTPTYMSREQLRSRAGASLNYMPTDSHQGGTQTEQLISASHHPPLRSDSNCSGSLHSLLGYGRWLQTFRRHKLHPTSSPRLP